MKARQLSFFRLDLSLIRSVEIQGYQNDICYYYSTSNCVLKTSFLKTNNFELETNNRNQLYHNFFVSTDTNKIIDNSK